MQGFIVHTAANTNGHRGAFYKAFNPTGAASPQRLADNYNANIGLRGYRHCNDVATCNAAAITAVNTVADDRYELLARAIARYNRNTGNVGVSWPDIMRGAADSNGNVCGLPCTYSIDVKNVRLGIPYRQYIWLGGTFPATHVNAGQEWCFAYGEAEWVNPGFNVAVPGTPPTSRSAQFNDYRDRADNDDTFKINCP